MDVSADDLKAEIASLRAAVKQRDRLLALRTRQNTQASEAWAKAAERALGGDPSGLRDRLAAWRDPAGRAVAIVRSVNAADDLTHVCKRSSNG